MREILFRGICTETKQWVFGSKYNDFIISYLEVDKFLKESDLFQCNCVIRDVVPETIGQFTGLLDKNGNKIFENDKVQFTVRRDYLGNNRPCNITFRSNVVFDDATFLISETSENDTPLCAFNQECEIIGNIHES